MLFVLLIVGMSFSMRSAFRDAHADRVILEDRFGGKDEFTPAVDGTVAGDRVAAFLAVRRALVEIHAEVEDVDREMGDFESLADDDPELRVALPAVARLTRSMLGLPWIFGEIEQVRNRALVESGMGLGEYTYIFVVAYHDVLVAPESEVHMFSGSPANRRVRADLQGMLRRQLAEAEAALGEDDELVRILAAEVDAMAADDERIPWQDGLPDEISECFVPYRDRLDASYSAAGAEFDLLNSSIKGGGFRIEMN